MRTEATFSRCARFALNSLLLTSCFFVCVFTQCYMYYGHWRHWRHISSSKDTNLLPFTRKRLDAWLGWLRKLMVVPSPEADQQVSSISSFELSALALKWSTCNYFAVTTTQWNLCFLHSYWLFFLFFPNEVNGKKNKDANNNNKQTHLFCQVSTFSRSNNLDNPDYPFLV